MRKAFISLALILCAIMSAAAQIARRDKSVYVEIMGPSNLIGVSYDARFGSNGHWGYRVGVGYAYGMVEIMALGDSDSHAVAFPAEINYLIGTGKHRLELGLGANLGYYHSSWTVMGDHYSDSSFGYYFYGNVGYRMTVKNGFQFRCGFTPSFNFGGSDAASHDTIFYPYMSFGYAF